MLDKIIEKITEEIWGKWISIILVFTILLIAGITINVSVLNQFSYLYFDNEGDFSKPTAVGFVLVGIISISLFAIFIWYICYVIKQNVTRKAKKGKAGILMYLDADTRNTYHQAKRKFGEEFQRNVYDGFDVVYAPYGSRKIEYRNRSIIKYLNKKRCLLFLEVRINTDENSNELQYDMRINGSIIHRAYKENIEKEFQRVFSFALSKFRNVSFESKEMVKKMRVTAEEMSFACDYIVGLSLSLNGTLLHAGDVLGCLLKRINANPDMAQMVVSVRRMLYEINMMISEIYMDRFQSFCTDESLLDNMNHYLELANTFVPGSYTYFLNKAYYFIAKERDSKKAKEYINRCKQIPKVPLLWRYSEAFLKAYDNKSIGSVITSYRMALKVPYNLPDLIVFIETILEKEPERFGLKLALGILYEAQGDYKLSKDNFNQYVLLSSQPDKSKALLQKKGFKNI